jgi:hypothetical protein
MGVAPARRSCLSIVGSARRLAKRFIAKCLLMIDAPVSNYIPFNL